MKLTKSMLEKLNKNELIKLILQLQEKNEQKSLYEQAKDKDTKIYEIINSIKYKYFLKPGDVLEVWSEEMASSSYARAGTEKLCFMLDLKEEKKYQEYLKIGFNRKLIESLKNDDLLF